MPGELFDAVVAEILKERMRQFREWGGIDHDMEHTSDEWITYIVKQLGLAIQDPNTFRERMVKVAALAIAAIEAKDFKQMLEDFDKAPNEEVGP